MKRILVIRGGAIGDFILTLPALKALRDGFPAAHIEILGYAHIASLAQGPSYANAVRSIEYGALSRFFARNAELPDELAAYFSGFDLIISYLFDPDRIFQTNLERSGADNILIGPSKMNAQSHAAIQLARPMADDLALTIPEHGAKIFPGDEDLMDAAKFLQGLQGPMVAFHPGSGSEKKNWPLSRWVDLAEELIGRTDFTGSLILVSGEADEKQAEAFAYFGANPRVRFAHSLRLPVLGAVLREAVFVGHDSGISHLAAAAGANCLLLFGPSDPALWAPLNPNAEVLRAPDANLQKLSLERVWLALQTKLV